jgi:hypothetical protein
MLRCVFESRGGSYTNRSLRKPIGKFVVWEQAMSDWNTTIIEEFRANEGKVGEFEGYSVILLHHVGAKSGLHEAAPGPPGMRPSPAKSAAVVRCRQRDG